MDSRKLKVVVVDDEEMDLYILMKNMNDNGYSAKGFSGGISAWEYLQENPDEADIIILDKMMGDLHGLEVVKLIKGHPALKHIPVMIQSGCTDTQEGFEAGADRYIVKPFSSEQLITAVDELASVKYLQ